MVTITPQLLHLTATSLCHRIEDWNRPGVVAHACDISIQGQSRGILRSRLHRKILSFKRLGRRAPFYPKKECYSMLTFAFHVLLSLGKYFYLPVQNYETCKATYSALPKSVHFFLQICRLQAKSNHDINAPHLW